MIGENLEHLRVAGADGVQLQAAVRGDGDRLILFLHGFPECCYAWHRQLPEFGRDHRAVALDLRGYNQSDKPHQRAAYALPRLVDDVRSVVHALSPDRPAVLVGHDWGGIIGWALARESPALLDRLVIINAPHPAVFRRELKHRISQVLSSSYAVFFQIPGISEMVLRAFRFAALRAMIYGTSAKPRMFTPGLRRIYCEAWAKPSALTSGLKYYRNPGALNREAAVSAKTRIQVPTLVLWGDRDPALCRSNLTGLDEFVAQLDLRRHPTATHWIVHEEPGWINDAIRNFVARP